MSGLGSGALILSESLSCVKMTTVFRTLAKKIINHTFFFHKKVALEETLLGGKGQEACPKHRFFFLSGNPLSDTINTLQAMIPAPNKKHSMA